MSNYTPVYMDIITDPCPKSDAGLANLPRFDFILNHGFRHSEMR